MQKAQKDLVTRQAFHGFQGLQSQFRSGLEYFPVDEPIGGDAPVFAALVRNAPNCFEAPSLRLGFADREGCSRETILQFVQISLRQLNRVIEVAHGPSVTKERAASIGCGLVP